MKDVADCSTCWAVYDDDKPVKKIEWEGVAKQQASVLVWNQRHPRQQPLDTPTPRVLSACVQGSTSLCHESNYYGADAAKSNVAGPSRLPSSPCHITQDLPLPTPSEEHEAVISPPVLSFPPPPSLPHQELRVCTCPLKSLIQWQSPYHLLPWTITLRPRPMKCPMQEHISH